MALSDVLALSPVACDAARVSGELIVAVLALVVAVLGAAFAWSQTRSARASASAARVQADRAGEQVDVARQAADAAEAQVAAARRQNELQKLVRRDQAQPYVVADVRPSPGDGHLLQVVVENRGSTIAHDVAVSFDPPLQMKLGPEQGEFTQLSGGISFLPPGRSMTWHLGTSSSYYENGAAPPDTRVTITCRGPFGELEPLVYTLSLAEMRHQEATAPGTLHRIETAVDKVAKAIEAAARKR